jgi:hypothetical protein
MTSSMPFVFVISSERSGGNLLLKLLDTHPEFCAPSPTHLISTFAPNRLRYGDLNDDARWSTLCEDVADFLETNLAQWRVRFDPRGLAKACESRSLAGVIRHVYESEARAYGKVRVADKDSHGFRFAPFLLAGFPDCRFVYLVRDPRDTALSFRNSKAHPGGIVAGGRRWRDDQARAVETHGFLLDSGRVHLVRYEELVSRPEETLKILCTFLGVRYAPTMLEFHLEERTRRLAARVPGSRNLARPIIADNFEKWRTDLTDEQVQAVELLCGEGMASLGYKRAFGPAEDPDGLLARLAQEEDLMGAPLSTDEIDLRARRSAVLRRIRARPLPQD